MNIIDIFALIIFYALVFIFIFTCVIHPDILLFSCILEESKEIKYDTAIISFKNFIKIFSVFSANFKLNGGCIYYKNEYKIFVKFPFNSLAKMMVRTEIRNRKKKAKKRIEYANTKDFISALEKDIAKMSK